MARRSHTFHAKGQFILHVARITHPATLISQIRIREPVNGVDQSDFETKVATAMVDWLHSGYMCELALQIEGLSKGNIYLARVRLAG